MQEQIIHYPRLDTILMVEETIRKSHEYPNKMQLWKALPRSMMYQTFLLILDYLSESGKILIDNTGKIFWVWDPKAVKRLVEKRLLIR